MLSHPPSSHIYVSVNWVSSGSGNGLLPVWCQAITWTTADLLSRRHLGTNFNEIRIKIQNFSLIKMHLKTCAKWQPFCPREYELSNWWVVIHVIQLFHFWLPLQYSSPFQKVINGTYSTLDENFCKPFLFSLTLKHVMHGWLFSSYITWKDKKKYL